MTAKLGGNKVAATLTKPDRSKTDMSMRTREVCKTFDPAQEPQTKTTVCFKCGWEQSAHKPNQIMSKTANQTEKAEAVKMLRKYLKPGSTVYCVLRSVSKSGMSRRIDFFTIVRQPGGKDYMQYLSGWMSTLGIGSLSRDASKPGLRVDGCGMDMGFHCVYSLASILFRSEVPAHDGGYALHSEWL